MGKSKIVAATKIQAKTYEIKIRALLARVKRTRFDLAIQRNFVWDDQRKSDLLYSILYGYPVPSVFSRVIDSDDKVEADNDWMLDGKQRLTTVLTYVMDGDTIKDENGKAIPERDKDNKPIMDAATNKPLLKRYTGWALSEDFPTLTFINQETGEEFEENVGGMTFSQLPEHVQDLILDSVLQVTRIKGMTDDEQDEFFRLTNQGMPLKPIELVRALAGHSTMTFINNLTSRPFFTSTVNISDKDVRFGREELAMQVIMLTHATKNKLDVPDLDSKTLKKFAVTLNEQGIDEDVKASVEQTVEYLSEALPNREKGLKKVHVHALFMVATQAMQAGIPASKFGGYVQDFLKNRVKKAPYRQATESGTAKADKVAIRLSAVINDYSENIAKSPEYVAPATPTPGKRGRKPKDQTEVVTPESNPVNQGEAQGENQNELVGANVEG